MSEKAKKAAPKAKKVKKVSPPSEGRKGKIIALSLLAIVIIIVVVMILSAKSGINVLKEKKDLIVSSTQEYVTLANTTPETIDAAWYTLMAEEDKRAEIATQGARNRNQRETIQEELDSTKNNYTDKLSVFNEGMNPLKTLLEANTDLKPLMDENFDDLILKGQKQISAYEELMTFVSEIKPADEEAENAEFNQAKETLKSNLEQSKTSFETLKVSISDYNTYRVNCSWLLDTWVELFYLEDYPVSFAFITVQ